jgi:predicted acylesterase/phospholipase RssA
VNSGTWLQKLWWKTRDLYHQLKPCRFCVGVAIVGLFVFTCVAQGVEVLRTVGEGVAAGNQWYPFCVVLFFVALILWAVCSWYACRVLLYFNFPNAPPPSARSKWAEANVPRLLGIAPIVIVALGFWAASRRHAPEDTTRYWLLGFAAFCVLLAIVFYLFVAYRRDIFRLEAIARVKHVHELSRGTRAGVAVVALISALLFIAFTVAPVVVAQKIGMGTILLLAGSSWVVLGSFLVFLSGRWQFPVIGSLVVLAIVFSLWNDNHRIRTLPARPVQRDSVIAAFEKWHRLVQKFPAPHPLYVVATEGGGIRAAYWTGIVLGGLQDANPNFANHVFAISGVSGGSLGAVVFNALVAENDGRSYETNAHEILSRDFLSPALAVMLYPDLVQRFLPVPIAYFDRARALELAWEKAWRDRMGNDRFAQSFVDLWPPDGQKWVPALFLNGTSVEKGNRIMTSNLRVTDSFFDVEDAAIKLNPDARATQAGCNIPLSTAAHMSARFTYVSPAGRFADRTYIVDGGYFENSGATTALEIVMRINEWCAFKHITDIDPKVIMISNNPRRPPIAPAKPGPEKERTLTKPETVHGGIMGEVMSPLKTLLNAREARGTFAQKAIAHQQRRFKAGDAAPPSKDQPQSMTPDIFYFALEDQDVPLPLGWMLSDAAAQTMRRQWKEDGKIVKNKTVADEISRTLPSAAP